MTMELRKNVSQSIIIGGAKKTTLLFLLFLAPPILKSKLQWWR